MYRLKQTKVTKLEGINITSPLGYQVCERTLKQRIVLNRLLALVAILIES